MAYLSDKFVLRTPFIVLNAAIATLGLGLFAFLPVSHGAGRYVGLFLAAAAVNSNIPMISAFSQTSIRAQSKRAFVSALVVGFGGLGGIVSTLVFPERDAPQFVFGMIFVMGAQGFVILNSLLMAFFFMNANRKANRGQKVIEGYKDFRYQI